MSRITVIDGIRTMRVSPEVAESLIRAGRGVEIDARDQRGHEAWLDYASGRPGLAARVDLDGPLDLPEGFWIDDSRPPWFTVRNEAGVKVGKSVRSREEALRMAVAWAESRAQGKTDGEEGED